MCEHFRIHIPFLHGLQVAEAGTVVGIVRDGITAAGLHMRNFMNDEGGGQGADFAKPVRIGKTGVQGAETTHGQAGNAGILRAVSEMKGFTDIVHQFLPDHGLVGGARGFSVQIEGILRRGHDNGEVIFFRQAFRDPVACFPGVAVQQEQRGHGTGMRFILFPRNICPDIVGNEHLKGSGTVKGIGEILDLKSGHDGNLLFYSFATSRTASKAGFALRSAVMSRG